MKLSPIPVVLGLSISSISPSYAQVQKNFSAESVWINCQVDSTFNTNSWCSATKNNIAEQISQLITRLGSNFSSPTCFTTPITTKVGSGSYTDTIIVTCYWEEKSKK